MLRSLIEWLDEFLAERGPGDVIKAIVGLLGFAALLGALVGNTAVKAGAVVSVILAVITMMLLLMRDRRRLQKLADRYSRLLTRYCDFIADDPRPTARVKEWNQLVKIDRNGDVEEHVTIRAISLREQLYFLTLRVGASWDQPHKYRRKVRVNIRSLLVDGQTGPSWNVTSSWLADGRLNLLAHLHEPVEHGQELTIRMERFWPGKCVPLMVHHDPDQFALKFDPAITIEAATYVVILPPGREAHYEPIGFNSTDGRFSLSAESDAEGRATFTLRVQNLDPDHRVGMRLELKRKKSTPLSQ
jgi:hypothetical protein